MNHSQNREITGIIPSPGVNPSIVLLARNGSERLGGCQRSGTLVQDGGPMLEGAWVVGLARINGIVVFADMRVSAVAAEVPDGVSGDGAFFDSGSSEGEGGEDFGGVNFVCGGRRSKTYERG